MDKFFGLSGIIIIGAFFFLFYGEDKAIDSKINGVSFVAPVRQVDAEVLVPIQELNANWVAVIPYSYIRPSVGRVNFGHGRQHWGETVEGTIKTVEYARQKGLKAMIKPHVWVIGQGWAGDFELSTEQEWNTWENSYKEYIMTFAKVADSLNVPMFCIGTEFRKAVVKRSSYWKQLISDVRKVYHGQLTYAANWDNYQNVPFWNEVDYIGIDAYFPLSSEQTPTIEKLNALWSPIKDDLKRLSTTFNKPILFTEFGYESKDFNTDGHWKYNSDTLNINLEAQSTAYEAILQSFWKEPWFTGGFLWKWHSNDKMVGGPNCKQYTPQNKPAEITVRRYFKSTTLGK